jgi:hypothetical protein
MQVCVFLATLAAILVLSRLFAPPASPRLA